VERSESIHFEVGKGNRCSAIMRRLGRSVDDEVWPQISHQGQYCGTITDIDALVTVSRDFTLQPFEDPAGVTFRAEEYSSLIIVDSGARES
jgi:hypothetical protein